MAKRTVQDLILERVNELGGKMDKLTTETIPSIVTAIAIAEAKAKSQAKVTAQIHGSIWGGMTLIISLAGLAVAYFK